MIMCGWIGDRSCGVDLISYISFGSGLPLSLCLCIFEKQQQQQQLHINNTANY